MNRDKLFELAFIYKKTKLWKMLWDNEIFAVSLPDGEIGYCSVMGAIDEYCALSLYVGEKGLDSYRVISSGAGETAQNLNYHELLFSQDCLQCAFETKDALTGEEAEAVREYARSHGIALRGRNAFPHFIKYQPNCMPWHVGEEDLDNLCAVLEAAIEVAAQVKKQGKDALGLLEWDGGAQAIPLLAKEDGAFVWSRVEPPPPVPPQYPRPQFINDISAARIRKLKKSGMWECQVLRLPQPVQDEPDCAPCFPALLMLVSSAMDEVLPPQISQEYDRRPEDFLEKFTDLLLERDFRPALLSIRDERTRVLMEDFCTRAGIRVRMCEKLPAMDDAVDSLMEHLGMDEPSPESISGLLDMLLSLDGEEMDELPDFIRQQLAALLESEELSPVKAARLAGTPDREQCRRQSYVIRVSCGRKCSRHIRISGGDTLDTLHEAIQEAFCFDRDHAYAFFMDNRLWSSQDVYYAPGVGDSDEMSTSDYCLGQLELFTDMQFKYLFDFGDEWVFQCRVLQILDEETEMPAVVQAKGNPPRQYS